MNLQMISVLTPFLAFSNSYINAKAHNMLDPRFTNMKVIQDYVGNMVVVNVVSKCDSKVVYPLLLQVYLHLNPMKAITDPITIEDDDYLFGHIVFIDDAIMSTLKNELQTLQQLCVRSTKIKNPLVWWATYVMQFPHVSFLAHQVLGIVGSQIEIKRIFNIASVITNLQWSTWN